MEMTRGRRAVKITMAAMAVLWVLLGAGIMNSWADESKTVLRSEDELIQWYRDKTKPEDKAAIVDGRTMCITKQVVLGPPGDTVNGTVKEKIELQIQGGPLRIMGKKGNAPGGLVINNPKLTIRGTGNLFSVEGYGRLSLENGSIILGEEPKPEIGPATIILKNNSEFVKKDNFKVKVEGSQKELQLTVKDERTDPPETDPTIPDESGPQPGGGGSGAELVPELTEAVLLAVGSDGSGSVRLEFEHLPADINALYIYRSDDGHSWTKEKHKVTAASSQSGQDTVEYENFLKESGNTLNKGILEDGYLIYHFQAGYSSFYVKFRIEWPLGGRDTQKIKVAVPDSVGQGQTFVYGGGGYGGGYGSYGSYGSYGGYGSDRGVGNGSYGNHSGIQPSSEEQQDAPEAPVRRGGRSRSRGRTGGGSYIPDTTIAREEGQEPSGENGPELASPSTPATPSMALVADEGMDTGEGNSETGGGPESASQEGTGGADTDPENAGQENLDIQESSVNRRSGYIRYTAAIVAAAAAGAAIWVYMRKRK